MFNSFKFKRSKDFKVGGYARNKGMGCRIMKVKSIEPPDCVVLETYGQTNKGEFLPAKRPRTVHASMLYGWYEPVEKVKNLREQYVV